MKYHSITFLLASFVLLAVLSASASAYFWACFGDGQRINFCNPATPDRVCNSDSGCTYCMTNYNATGRCYNQASINACNMAPNCTSTGAIGNTTQRPTFAVTLTSPNDGFTAPETTSATNITFSFTVTNVSAIRSCTLMLNDAAVASNKTRIVSTTNKIIYGLLPGMYNWTISCTDRTNRTGEAPGRLLTIPGTVQPTNNTNTTNQTDPTPTTPLVALFSPGQGEVITSPARLTNISFLYTTQGMNFTRCNLLLDNRSVQSNMTGLAQMNQFARMLQYGNYTWSVRCVNRTGVQTLSTTGFFTIMNFSTQNTSNNSNTSNPPATNYPVQLLSPAADTTTTETTIGFSFMTNQSSIRSCALFIDGQNVSQNTSLITSQSNTIEYALAIGSYRWNVECVKSNNARLGSENRTLTISAPPAPVTSGGGGGGGGGGSSRRTNLATNRTQNLTNVTQIVPLALNVTNQTETETEEPFTDLISEEEESGLGSITGATIAAQIGENKRPIIVIMLILLVVGALIYYKRK